MGPRIKNWCQAVVLKAISVAHPAFKHSCSSSCSHKASIVRGSLIDKYCTAVNGTTATLIPTGQYKICHSLRYHIIDTELNSLSVRINKIDSNTTTKVHADSNNNNNDNNNDTIGLLVPKEEEGQGLPRKMPISKHRICSIKESSNKGNKSNNNSNHNSNHIQPRI